MPAFTKGKGRGTEGGSGRLFNLSFHSIGKQGQRAFREGETKGGNLSCIKPPTNSSQFRGGDKKLKRGQNALKGERRGSLARSFVPVFSPPRRRKKKKEYERREKRERNPTVSCAGWRVSSRKREKSEKGNRYDEEEEEEKKGGGMTRGPPWS